MKIALKAPENPYIDQLLAALRAQLPEDTLTHARAAESLDADTEVLFALGKITGDDLAPLKQLKLLQTVSDGYDAVDIDAATAAGIWVSYSPGEQTGNAQSVAEFAILLLLATARHLNAVSAAVDGSGPKPVLNSALLGKTVCIVGFGDIGQCVAKRLAGFDAKLIAVDHHPEKHDAPSVTVYKTEAEALPLADFVVLCVRGSHDNEHMVNAEFLSQMKPSAVLVNIARGSLVDEEALLAAVRAGKLAGAGLDVTEHEPLDPGDPLLAEAAIFVTPHVAGFTDATLSGSVQFLNQVMDAVRNGKRPASLLNEPEHPRLPLR